MNTEVTQWDGDVLERKTLGDFLYKVVLQRYSADYAQTDKGSLCIAIDADWGAGKSFFVGKWSSDIEAKSHPVMRFDAWLNDLSDDPLLGFMAQLQTTLDSLIKSLPVEARVKKSFLESLDTAKKQAGRAIIPALKTLGKGAIKKVIGVDYNELNEQINAAIIDDAKEVGALGLEDFFDKALTAHTSRQKSIEKLKEALSHILKELEDKSATQLPFFIFIDELDRCRPDYAIRLLEGVKHLFDANGICFVFSTNLKQLSASACAIYGEKFSGYRYLKRFFAFEYNLPKPSNTNFAKALTRNSQLKSRTICSSLHESLGNLTTEDKKSEAIAKEFAIVSDSFNLDLRSQHQVLLIAETAAAGLNERSRIFPIYLFFLSATFHRGRECFDKFSPENRTALDNIKTLDIEPVNIHYSLYDHGHQGYSRNITDLKIIISLFLSVGQLSLHQLSNSTQHIKSQDYPNSIKLHIENEKPSNQDIINSLASDTTKLIPSVNHYHSLISYAGQIIAE